tara:strand:- start:560 stop:1339 length:780 start_codon:yes stop_codon:yes gene_type:complete
MVLELHFTRKKFRDFQENEVPAISYKINQFAFSVGIREPLEDLECHALGSFLKNEFNDFSISELDLVADKYSAGKLNFTDSHYQILSKDFLGKVLKAYRVFRNKELIKFHREKEEIEKAENPITEEKKKEIHEQFLETIIYKPYEKAIKNKTQLFIEDDIAFNLFVKLFKNGVLKPNKEEVKRFKNLACEQLAKPKMETLNMQQVKNINKLMKKLKLVMEDNGDFETKKLLQEKSCSLYFNNWLNEKLRLKLDIKTLIK